MKTEHYLKDIQKCDKKKFKSQFCKKPQHVFQTVKVNLSDATPFSKTCGDFVGGFWGAKIVKKEHNLKNIHKCDKKKLKSQFC